MLHLRCPRYAPVIESGIVYHPSFVKKDEIKRQIKVLGNIDYVFNNSNAYCG